MYYTINDEAIDVLANIATRHYKLRSEENSESAYLLYGCSASDEPERRVIEQICACPNSHEDPWWHFGISRVDAELITRAVQVVKPSLDIVGSLHTHEAKGVVNPSLEDIEAARTNYIGAVVSAYGKRITFYDGHGYIDHFTLRNGKLYTRDNEELTSEYRIAQYPFPTDHE